MPEGYEIQVRTRSGLAAKHGITVINSPGTIDPDYRGELKVLLVNLSNESFELKPGESVAQLVFARYERLQWEEAVVLGVTQSGAGGVGWGGKSWAAGRGGFALWGYAPESRPVPLRVRPAMKVYAYAAQSGTPYGGGGGYAAAEKP